MHPGNVSDYLSRLQLLSALPCPSPSAPERSSASSTSKPAQNPKELRRRRAQLQQELKPLKQRGQQLEQEIARLEGEQATLESAMADPEFYKNGEQAQRTMAAYEANKSALESSYEAWSEVSDELAAAEKDAQMLS